MANTTTSGPLAHVYAEALYDAAVRAGELPRVMDELRSLQLALARAPMVLRFFESPVITFGKKRRVVETALAACSKTTRNFMLVVIERGRGGLLEAIAVEFHEHAHRVAGIALVELRSARALEPAERERVVAVLTAKLQSAVKLEEKVQPELLGGIQVVHEDRLWDASLARALKGAVARMAATR